MGAVASAAAPSPGHGTSSHFALLSKLLQPAPRSPSTPLPRRPLPYLLPGNTWLCGTPKRSFLGAYSLTWDERGTERQGTEAGVWASSRPRSALVRGWQPEGAPRNSGGQAGVRQRQGLRSGTHRSQAVRVGCRLLRHCGALPLAAW